MTEEEMIAVVAGAARADDQTVERLDLRGSDLALLEEILAADEPGGGAQRAPRRPRGRTRALRLGAALAGVAAAGALILGGIGSDGDEDRLAFAAEWIEIAERNPRLLVTAPGWEVTRADESQGEGEMTFSNGTEELDVHWRPADTYNQYFRDRAHGNPHTEITLLGRTATMFQYVGSTDFTTFLPAEGPTFVEIRGDLGSRAAYLEVVRSLEPTDVETWLSAMPPSVVRPLDRDAAVAGMLEGIPLPPGLDPERIADSGDAVRERYHLGAAVTGTVACRWFDLWTEARADGDSAAAAQAEAAMATSREWPILREMTAEGDWSPVVWEYARKMEAGTLKPSEYRMGLGCGRFR